MIRVSGLSVGYGSRRVVEGVSLNLAEGESVLVIGHNGSGKTTLLKTLCGLIPPLSGSGTILGLALSRLSPRPLLLRGGRYLGQGPRGFDELRIQASRAVLSRLYGMEPNGAAPPSFSRTRIGQLSVGQRRLEALRLISAGDPRLFLLDEPLAGVDPGTESATLRWLEDRRRRGAGFLIVEQNFRSLLERVDRALVLRGSSVAYYGAAGELADRERLMESYL